MYNVAIILAPFVFLAYGTEALSGFGSTLVAVTLGAHFYPIDKLVPVLVPLNFIVTGYIALRHYREIELKLLLRSVFPFMGVGVVVGTLLFPYLAGATLRLILGLVVTIFAIRELILLKVGKNQGPPFGLWLAGVWQFIAGIVHAFYATGGPPLVYSISRLNLSKGVFRATLCTVWATMNLVLMIIFVFKGRINQESLTLTGILLPLLPLGIIGGEWLHGRINEKWFRIFIYCLLLLSGVALLAK
jgi:uncharacterized protein